MGGHQGHTPLLHLCLQNSCSSLGLSPCALHPRHVPGLKHTLPAALSAFKSHTFLGLALWPWVSHFIKSLLPSLAVVRRTVNSIYLTERHENQMGHNTVFRKVHGTCWVSAREVFAITLLLPGPLSGTPGVLGPQFSTYFRI